ncbi:hypothetical protein Moror_7474 [Moniliophthora roreri MCA 2997]|uniref:Uncharacterized protein n=1 Tax=Moniliophthora roreri (strain MCA 2997) TaxID=1381753 RepID=V2XQE5_MONRO|nr:hypothetical protein Moror_7474 [Moniliophthora roreri MCA 2997]
MYSLAQTTSLFPLATFSINWPSHNSVLGTLHGYIRTALDSLYLKPPEDPGPSRTIPLVFETTTTRLFVNGFEYGIWNSALIVLASFSGLALGCRKNVTHLVLLAALFSPIAIVLHLCPDMFSIMNGPFIGDMQHFWNSMTLDNYVDTIQCLYANDFDSIHQLVIPFFDHSYQSVMIARGTALSFVVASMESGYSHLVDVAKGGLMVVDVMTTFLQVVHGIPLPTFTRLAFTGLGSWVFGWMLVGPLIQAYSSRPRISSRLAAIIDLLKHSYMITIDMVLYILEALSAATRMVLFIGIGTTNGFARLYDAARKLPSIACAAYGSPDKFRSNKHHILGRMIIFIVFVPAFKPEEGCEVLRTMFYIDLSAAYRTITNALIVEPRTI